MESFAHIKGFAYGSMQFTTVEEVNYEFGMQSVVQVEFSIKDAIQGIAFEEEAKAEQRDLKFVGYHVNSGKTVAVKLKSFMFRSASRDDTTVIIGSCLDRSGQGKPVEISDPD